MSFSFIATIYKIGVNACVDVPLDISVQLSEKGYIPIKGKINGKAFTQTLVPVKDNLYRLYVNIPMLKSAGVKAGETVEFNIALDLEPRVILMPAMLKDALYKYHLMDAFERLTKSRQKGILNYLNALKKPTSIKKNVDRVIQQLLKENF